MSGKWLEVLAFNTGLPVNVTTELGRVVVEVDIQN
ncbi:type I addiction module toxin, SymE family [Limnobaculum parvum]|uniref:Type I addiction module toxin, SymE family n=1 Tax=Limnobaculum parvum TaxID=2172103 RepID=A0A2Y9TU07_9GAMM|nr:type I addiction module toxin, SymE family [Limnobaculum parvum]